VLIGIRSESPRNRRAFAWSADGATEWTQPFFDDTLPEPVCMAALTRIEPRESGAQPVLLFSNPASLETNPRAPAGNTSRLRQNLTLRASRDGGRSWPESLVIESGPSAYSDLAVMSDGTILCFYERGDSVPYETLAIKRITPAVFPGDSK
jgi:sialidase-1